MRNTHWILSINHYFVLYINVFALMHNSELVLKVHCAKNNNECKIDRNYFLHNDELIAMLVIVRGKQEEKYRYMNI